MADLSEAAKRALEAALKWATAINYDVNEVRRMFDASHKDEATYGFACGHLSREDQIEGLKASVADLERGIHNSRTALRLAVARSKGASFTLRRGTKTTLGWEIWRYVEVRDSAGKYMVEQIIPLESGPDGLPVVTEEAFKALEELK